jgi:hypothetical protein
MSQEITNPLLAHPDAMQTPSALLPRASEIRKDGAKFSLAIAFIIRSALAPSPSYPLSFLSLPVLTYA